MLTRYTLVSLAVPGCMAVTSKSGPGNGAYNGLNVCHYVGDDPSHVSESRIALARYFGVPADHLIIPGQTHSAEVRVVDTTCRTSGLDGVDGLVTAADGLVLCVCTADCVPVLLADEQARVIAAVHSGWRGTVARISAAAVYEMCRLGADPHRIKAVMGPCICPGCFEVGPEVARRFIDEFSETPGIVISRPGHRDHIDLGAAIKHTLTEAGIVPANIALPMACSHCENSEYFSARRQGIASGRTVTAIMLAPPCNTAPLR